ncbi:hypothetical protein DH2020_042602 [Rehmannia glutinosa]|uniref:CDT1 Geminin-binding domain-containing protein n=1 Tax=Rehmannia glutinosa TaxID=99300 RepID=A0ABR0UMY7_REHGL
MGEPTQDKTAQDMPKSCSAFSSSTSPEKDGFVETHHLEEDFSSPTPVKTKEPSRIKSKEELAELPEKYQTLLEFFERMTSSLRLLRLRKRTPNFQNISSQVEILSGSCTTRAIQPKSIAIKADSISEDLSIVSETKILNSSHIPPSFKRQFYQKAAATAEVEKTAVKSASEVNGEINEETERLRSLPGSSSTANMSESTPMKLLLGSDSVLVETPALSTPMRSISPTRSVLTCEDENKMTGSQIGKHPTSSAKKSLDFYTMDDQDNTSFSHKQSSVCLSDLVFLIHQIFKSVNFCSITKEELVQKIIMNNFEFNDHHEVEMQMEDLERLVPDWFSKKLAPSGDLLLYK